MKKLQFALLCISLFSTLICKGQERPIIVWEEKVHDFKTIDLNNDNYTIQTTYKFLVRGDNDLVILGADTSCSCMTVTYPQKPIKSGDTCHIALKMNMKGIKGKFDKKIFIRTNGIKPVELLRAKGYIKN